MPTNEAVTPTDTVQLPLAGMLRRLGRLTVFAPATAFTVAPPPQVVAPFGEGAITTPDGNVSISAAVNVATVAFAFDNVTVSVDTPPTAMEAGLNALVRVGTTGSCARTVNVATAGAGLLPLLVCNEATANVLM